MTPLHDASAQRFVVAQPDGEAFLRYESAPTAATITHTFVPPAWRGRGVAELLVRAFLTWAAQEGRHVESHCSYATAFLARHPELAPTRPR